MPDNNKNSVIDEQFTNFAWAEMHKLLEEEMPVAEPPKKRRYLLFLLLFCLAVGGLTTLLATHNLDGNKKNTEPTKAVAIAQGQTQNEKDIIQESENCPELEPVNLALNDNTNTLQKKAVINKNHKSQISTSVHQSNTIASTPIQVVSPIESLPNNTILSTQEDLIVVNNKVPFGIAAFSNLPTPLVGLEYASLVGEQLKRPKVKKQSAFVKAIMPTRIGVEGGILSNELAQIDGYHLGLTAKYNLKAKPWAIHTGVSYALQRQSVEFGRFKSSDAAVSFDPNSETTDIGNQDTISPVSDPALTAAQYDSLAQLVATNFTIHVHKLDLPILFSFRADDRLHIDLGVQASYILAANTGREEILPFSNDLYRSSSTFNQGQAFSDNSSFSVDNVNRFDLALRGGLTYYPGKNFGLRLHYQFGLINTSESNRYRSHNRALRVSAAYYF